MSARSFKTSVVSCVGLAALLSSAGCGTTPAPPPTNLIVISVDTLRADHMSLHGYIRPTTPRIDAFAATGATFDRARAPWPKTVPSLVSMFTSRPPHVTGVMFGSRGQYVEDDELMLAEVASRNGLRTGAVVSNAVVGAATNFGQGFDTYLESYKLVEGLEGYSAGTVTDTALTWLDGVPQDEAIFLWVHYVDPHATYDPPAGYADEFFEDAVYDSTELRLNRDDGNFNSGVAGRYWHRNGGQAELGWYVANYDGEIVYTDEEIGRLLDTLNARGAGENSLIILTADHGESLGEHRYYFEHGWYPYNASSWIPFVLRWPGMPQPGSRISYPVGLVNLVPTIADIMGWSTPEDAAWHGTSLLPVLQGDTDRVDDYVIIEAGEGGLQRDEFLRAIEDGRWKLVHVPNEEYQRGMQQMEYELYEVRDDPMETVNIIGDHPDLAELMKQVLAERLSQTGNAAEGSDQQPQYSEEEIENLRSLGYIR